VKSGRPLKKRVDVTLLKGEDRVLEIARMMGRETEANLRHARQMLKDAKAE